MNQSSVIFGAIAIAFLVYITRKGELPTYAGLLLLGPGGSGTTKTAQAQSSGQQISGSDVVTGAMKAIALFG